MTLAGDDVLIGGQLPQSHGASCMELLGGNAHFAAQAKLAAVGKPGGSVDVDCGTVHTGSKGSFLRRSGQRRCLYQRFHPVHRRRRIWPGLRNGHFHPKAPCPWAYGPAGAVRI